MPTRAELAARDDKAKKIINGLRFVTPEQLAYWLKVSDSTARRILNHFVDRSICKMFSEQKPTVYRLSDSEARRVGAETRARWYSAPAMHQYLVRNAFEIYYRKHVSDSFRILDRSRVMPFGLLCQKAEHAARLNDELVLVVIDDYLMSPDRIGFILDRVHETQNNRLYLDRVKRTGKTVVPTWRNAIKKVLVVTNFQAQTELFEKSFSKSPLNVPHEIHLIDPIWSIA